MIQSVTQQLLSVSKEIDTLESLRRVYIKSISDNLQKTILQWS